jgi:ABC-2 type transport system ATP-binding protein
MDRPLPLPEGRPASWLQPEAADCVIHFVHSNYKQQITERELAEFFPSARTFSLDPMPLRSIFLAIAKSGRKHGPSAANAPRRVEA